MERRAVPHEMLRLLMTDLCLGLLAGCVVASLLAWLRPRRTRSSETRAPSVIRARGQARRADGANAQPSTGPGWNYRLVEPAAGQVAPGEEDHTALRATLEVRLGGTDYLVSLAYDREAEYDRALRQDAGRFRAIAVPYRISVRRNRGPAVMAGVVRLTFDGPGKLARATVRKMKAPFPFLQAPIHDWLRRFMAQEFTYRQLLAPGSDCAREAI